MRCFRIKWPWMLAMCSGSALALGIVTGHGSTVQAEPVPPAGIETWDESYPTASSRPLPFAYPDEYAYEYGEHSYDPIEPEGKYGYREMVSADVAEAATVEEDRIGQLGNAANFSHERDWENAPYEFGDGTTIDVKDLVAQSVNDAETEEADASFAFECGIEADADDGCEPEYGYESEYGHESEYGYGRAAANFTYPEEYFYKYGYSRYDHADSAGEYGSSMSVDADADAEEDRIGQLGNAANFSHERDWENAPYEFGDGTSIDVKDLIAQSGRDAEAEEADVSLAYEFGIETAYDDEAAYGNEPEYGNESAYGDGQPMADYTYPEEDFSAYGYPHYDYADLEGEYGSSATADADANVNDVAVEAAPEVDAWDADLASRDGYDEYGYDEYGYGMDWKYSYPAEKYGNAAGMQSGLEADAEAKVDYEAEYDFDSRYEGEPGELIDYSQWKEPYAYDAAESADTADDSMAEWSSETGLESFAQHPRELLRPSDLELLQTLEALCEEPSGARRSVLNDYLESLDFMAIDFSVRFEDVTGMETLSLADDLSGVAAFLSCFRLVEQGELGMDEAVDLLRRTVERPSWVWIEGVREAATGADEGRPGHPTAERSSQAAAEPVARALASVFQATWSQLQGTGLAAADRLARWDWEAWFTGLQDRLAEVHSASQYDAF